MAPKESLWGKERGRENGSLGGFFFSFNCARGTTSPYHITGTTSHFPPPPHTCIPIRGELCTRVTDCYARNVLYHSTVLMPGIKGLFLSSDAERAEYR